MEFEFREISIENTALKDLANDLSAVFKSDIFTVDYLKWLYVDNPYGEVVGYNAYHNDVWAGHYAIVPVKANLNGKEHAGLLSLNTAVHENFRGQKLFTQLALKSYDLASSKGFDFIVGVANANSTPGFLKHLGFKLLGPLTARVGRFEYVLPNETAFDFNMVWTEEALTWRFKKPGQAYYRNARGEVFVNAAKGIDAFMLNDKKKLLSLPQRRKNPLTLWIGSEDAATGLKGVSVNIPKSVRPSPLNLIFKSLNASIDVKAGKRINFQLIDFDAY